MQTAENPQAAKFTSHTTPPAGERARGPAYWFVFQGDKLLVRPTADIPRAADLAALGLPDAADGVRPHYLGYLADDDGAPIDCYCAEISPATPLPEGLIADGLRALYPRLGDLLFSIAGRGIQVVAWDRTHRFCGQCGAATVDQVHERAKRCPACGLISYPRLSPAIIIAIVRRTDGGDRLLLARSHRFPPGRFSVIAGFVEPGETLEACAQREVCEEVGIRIRDIRYFGSQPWPFPNSLMIAFTAEYAGGEITLEESEIAEAGWFAADALPDIPPRMSISRRLIDWFVAGQPEVNLP